VIDVRPAEMRALGWSWLYIFSGPVLSYYILRPIRDEMGGRRRENLQWLFTGTLLGMLVINRRFAALVGACRESSLSPLATAFLANLLLFALLLHVATAQQNIWIGRLFFIWTSVLTCSCIDLLGHDGRRVRRRTGKRLSSFIAAGATLGGIVGSSLTASLARQVSPTYLC
jgi:AAA family ATP:ADP antiporter